MKIAYFINALLIINFAIAKYPTVQDKGSYAFTNEVAWISRNDFLKSLLQFPMLAHTYLEKI